MSAITIPVAEILVFFSVCSVVKKLLHETHKIQQSLDEPACERSLCAVAKQQGYRARSAFKLLKSMPRIKLLKPACVWSISAPRLAAGRRWRRRNGASGHVFALDLLEMVGLPNGSPVPWTTGRT